MASVGPGDTLYLTVYGQPELAAQVTIDVQGRIVVPFLGEMAVGEALGHREAHRRRFAAAWIPE